MQRFVFINFSSICHRSCRSSSRKVSRVQVLKYLLMNREVYKPCVWISYMPRLTEGNRVFAKNWNSWQSHGSSAVQLFIFIFRLGCNSSFFRSCEAALRKHWMVFQWEGDPVCSHGSPGFVLGGRKRCRSGLKVCSCGSYKVFTSGYPFSTRGGKVSQ